MESNNKICNCKALQKELNFFQELMLRIVKRKVIFERFESKIEGKIKEKNISLENDFLMFIFYNYLCVQLSDCRKFFDQDTRVFYFGLIIRHLDDEKLKGKHKKFLNEWENNFQKLTNEYFLHSNRNNYKQELKLEVSKFNDFIARLNNYLDEIVESLSVDYEVANYDRNPDNTYFSEVAEDVDKFFEVMGHK